MSGKIELKVRKHPPKRGNLKYYPGWIWKVYQENGYGFFEDKFVELMPSWDDMEKAITETIIHEMKVDNVTGRNPDRQRYQLFLKNMIKKCQSLQTKLLQFSEIEEIYTNCKK